MKGLKDDVGKVMKCSRAASGARHPHHGSVKIRPKHNYGIELLYKVNIVVFTQLHQVVETQLLTDPQGISEIRGLAHLLNVHELVRANR